jgi:hypothetical protein
LFAANEPVLSEFRHRDVRLRMQLKVLDSHVTSYELCPATPTY